MLILPKINLDVHQFFQGGEIRDDLFYVCLGGIRSSVEY